LRGGTAGDPEVGHLHASVAVDDDVVRLDVAVHDPVPVRVRERCEDLARVLDDDARRGRAPRHDELLDVAAVEELHRDVVRPLRLAPVVDRDDVRVRERGGALRLAAEPLDELVVARVALVEDLDRHAPAEHLVLGEVDVRHAAAPDPLEDPVAPVEERVDQRVGDGHAAPTG
jgi:hypothetical protein